MSFDPTYVKPDGDRHYATAIIIANVSKPTKEKPSLLDHGEAETLFHEFGHLMHGICCRNKISRFGFTGVEWDFIEAPSQMLENWLWQPEVLKRISSHYKTGDPMPDDLIERLIKSKNAANGGQYLRQIVLTYYDQKLHSSSKNDTEKLYADLYFDVIGIPAMPNTNFAASFKHTAVGYDAQYYSYLVS
jgi:thimet oligopeptidase